MPHWPIADLINWGWLRIGPPYIYININPVIFQMGPLAVRWYGLMYVVGILAGLQVAARYTARKGISEEALYRTLWCAIVAGLLGGRLYFVIQQHDFVQDYLQKPWNILATWNGGMAFYGAIFLVIPTLYWRARAEHVNPLVLIDAGVLFATAGQIFGRIGNLINGDIIGYRSTLPWSTVYVNPNSWACNPYVALPTCGTPVQPAAGYELISNLVLLVIMLYLAWRVTRPGILMLVYLFSYSILQFFLFFVRDNSIEAPFGLNWGLKQAQWTSLVLLVVLLPITYWVLRTSKPVPAGEIAATYGIPQRFRKKYQQTKLTDDKITANKYADDFQLKQDSGLGSEEDAEGILKSDPAPVVNPDSSQATLQSEPDTIAISDNIQVELDTLPISDHTQSETDTSSMFDTLPIADQPLIDTDTNSDADTLLITDHPPIDPDTSPDADTLLIADHPPIEPDTSPDADTLLITDQSTIDTDTSPDADTLLITDQSTIDTDTSPDADTLLITDQSTINTDTSPDADTLLIADQPPINADTSPDADTLLIADQPPINADTSPDADTLLIADQPPTEPDISPNADTLLIADQPPIEPDTNSKSNTSLVSVERHVEQQEKGK